MRTRSYDRTRYCDRHTPADTGQAALVLVIALTVVLTLFGGVMVNSFVNNAPIIKQASIQRYAYRALASGLNAYQNAINADPYLAACNSTTNFPLGSNANPQCAGISYQSWSEVPGTDVGNGVIPEYYKFDNPQQVKSSTTNSITYLEVQIVGAAGFPGKNVFYSTVAKFTPQNGFLNGVWWSNYESFDPSAGGSAANCKYFYANPGPNRRITGSDTVAGTTCVAVDFASGDALYGPVYSNDSLFITGSPTFTGTVNTADPHCQFVDYTNAPDAPDCTGLDAGNYTVTGSGFNHAKEPLPTDNSELAAYAKQGGCYYEGPTTITLSVVSGVGKMTVVSPDTTSTVAYPGTGGTDTMNTSSVDTSTCPTNGTGNLPVNGVLYVNNASHTYTGANPYDLNTNNASQVLSKCANCYYGQSGTPDTEGDAFVGDASGATGGFSGHLTVAAYNDVIIDGPLVYHDCTWVGTASQSLCNYNDATTSTSVNDTLGLIANNYVEVNRPVNNTNQTPLSDCGSSGALAPPLCDPATTTGSPTGNQGLTIDATILALNQSFAVNNYSVAGNEGQLTVYGSIQQDARGAVGLVGGTGYLKYYLWDPRLTLYGPPYYLTPGTPSWILDSSAESYIGSCPNMPPPQQTPVSTQPVFPWPLTTDASHSVAGTACVSAS